MVDLKPFRSNQRKAFYWKKIPESRCVRKEIVDMDIFVTSKPMPRNGIGHSASDNLVSLSLFIA